MKLRKVVLIVLCLTLIASGLVVPHENNAKAYTFWTERQPAGNVDREWAAVASSDDGSHLIAASYNQNPAVCGLYTSSDYGVTLIERKPAVV